MNMNEFKKHLQNVDGILFSNQKSLQEGPEQAFGTAAMKELERKKKKKRNEEEVAEDIAAYVDYFYDGLDEINEDDVLEAIHSLNNFTESVLKWAESDNEEYEDAVGEYFNSYFGDSLHEGIVDDNDFISAIEDLVEMCNLFNAYFRVEEE